MISSFLMPPQFGGSPPPPACIGPQLLTTHAPVLRVNASTVENSLSLHIALLSTVGTTASRDPRSFHAFLRVDGRTLILNLPPGGYISLTYPGLSPGIHRVQYGVFSGSRMWNAGELCPRIAK